MLHGQLYFVGCLTAFSVLSQNIQIRLISTQMSPVLLCVKVSRNRLVDAFISIALVLRITYLVTVYKEEDIGQLLNNSKIQEFWIGLHCDSSNWHWSDGEKLTYSNWDRDLFCAFAQSNGSWSDSVCNENKTFICYNS
uniref:C-type lectin domain-containing protein n=1 Tax=Erpetoichthys calabaricus TaxID=27687 RepID=A0A8C4SW12_ERPCA